MRNERIICGLIFLCCLPLEALCAYLAFETIGEIVSLLYFIAAALNLPLAVLAWKKPLIGAIACIVLAAAIVPYQLVLAKRLVDVQAEATRIVAFAYSTKGDTGSFPSDLRSYSFANPSVARFFQKYTRFRNSDGFQLVYRIGTVSTSHWYSTEGGWGYAPD
ncbi:hypothetical protein ESB00_03880 [Oleiharenicola lentus]|uniref:Uncharacterized protein n=1 Tax=Oleiharenicola lentus TaxID=2508720 RepID=A0A4V1M6D8_9BACT|nr:hypothetical protein [Oleiharenicola lentus]RXK55049.1 hypothetical protein ESB00_03880 [Oleiharenicola lentus]